MMDRSWLITVLLVVLTIGFAGTSGYSATGPTASCGIQTTPRKCKLGARCSSSGYCNSEHLSMKKPEICVNGFCECDPDIEMRYSSYDMNPTCDSSLYSLKIMMGKCNESECTGNMECVERLDDVMSAFSREQRYGNICVCKEGYIRFNSKCVEFEYRKVLHSCYGRNSGPVYVCNLKKHSFCNKRKCVCYDSFFANETSGECEPMENYVKAYNLTSYKVKPGEYCSQNSHCIDGLKCVDYTCRCPEPCIYRSKEEICDCGEIVYPAEDILWPTIVGLIGSVLIILFWVSRCKKTIRKYESKKLGATRTLNESDGQEDTTSPEPIALSPQASSSYASQILFQPPESKTPSKVATPLVPPNEKSAGNLSDPNVPRPSQPPSYGLTPNNETNNETNPPQPSQYGLPPSGFVNPPPYAPPYSGISQQDAPPPYSLLPPPMNSGVDDSSDVFFDASRFPSSPNPSLPSAPALPGSAFDDSSVENTLGTTASSNKL